MAPEFTSNSFPLGDNRQMVAPFWADIVYPEANYTAKGLFVATWDHVGYYNSTTNKASCELNNLLAELHKYYYFV